MDDKRYTTETWKEIGQYVMDIMIQKGKPFNADDYFLEAKSNFMPSWEIKRIVGAMFRQYQAAGKIRKRSDYKLSTRNGGNTLPMWESQTQQVQSGDNAFPRRFSIARLTGSCELDPIYRFAGNRTATIVNLFFSEVN